MCDLISESCCNTSRETAFVLLLVMFGCVVYASAMGNIASLAANYNVLLGEYHQQVFICFCTFAGYLCVGRSIWSLPDCDFGCAQVESVAEYLDTHGVTDGTANAASLLATSKLAPRLARGR